MKHIKFKIGGSHRKLEGQLNELSQIDPALKRSTFGWYGEKIVRTTNVWKSGGKRVEVIAQDLPEIREWCKANKVGVRYVRN